MHRTAIAATSLALALAAGACARQPAAPASPAAGAFRGKPSAPVSIDARLAAGTARVTVRFDADAKDVRIDVHGVDGLSVASAPTPVEHAAFARGESTSFDVTFAPGPGRSHLAVTVSGSFHGDGRRATVASFAVGEPTPEQRKKMDEAGAFERALCAGLPL